MNISSINSRSSAIMMKGMQRPDPSKMAEDLFSKLDTKGQGYIEKSDLESALSRSNSSNSSSRSNIADKMFSKLDDNGDGKVTQEEMSATIQKIASELDGSSPRMRMQGGMPPPPSDSQSVQETSSTDSTTSSSQSSDPTGTNGDGAVSAQEGLAYEDSKNLSGSSTDSSSSSASSVSSADAKFMKQMMRLLTSYGGFDQRAENSDFSTSA